MASSDNLYHYSFNLPNGIPYPINNLKGKVVLIVNTATQCGLAPQFEELEELHQKYKDKGLVVLGFPCNQFRGQEPETNDTMVETCAINHGVSFQLTEKIDVNGAKTHPVFKWLKRKSRGFFGSRVKWNFTKFLVDKNGNMKIRYAPVKSPKKIEPEIVELLNKPVG